MGEVKILRIKNIVRVIWTIGFGEADLEKHEKFTQSKFDIFSCGQN